MYRFMLAGLLLTALFITGLPAQETKKLEDPPTKSPGAKAAAEEGIPGEVEVHFLNGSKVRMIIQSEKLEINTIYGKVAVPIQDVQAIEFGLHFPDGAVAKIDLAIKNLGNGDYREREKAAKALLDLGPYSYSAVLKATRAKEGEIASRAKEIVQKLQAKHAKKDLRTTTDDKVVTPTHTIVGRIMTTTVKTKADYFGELEHKLANMRTLRAIVGPGLDLDLSLDAGKYANPSQWLETSYQVDGRSMIVIAAKGQIDYWPQQPGGYICGPNGMQGGGRFGGGPGGGGGFVVKGAKVLGPIQPNIYGGTLLGKVGEDGEPFVIGDRYEGRPETEGKLYLHIGPSPYNCPSAGAYDVKISRKND